MDNHQNLSEDSEFFNGIVDLVKSMQQLANDACAIYELQVNAIIEKQSKDLKQIEGVLSRMLDFCFYDNMLLLFKSFAGMFMILILELHITMLMLIVKFGMMMKRMSNDCCQKSSFTQIRHRRPFHPFLYQPCHKFCKRFDILFHTGCF